MQDLLRVESLIVVTAVFALLVYIHRKSEAARPYTWAFLPGVFANIVFYVMSVLWRYKDIRLQAGALSDISNYRVQAVIIPALIVLSVKAHELWKSTGRK